MLVRVNNSNCEIIGSGSMAVLIILWLNLQLTGTQICDKEMLVCIKSLVVLQWTVGELVERQVGMKSNPEWLL